MCQFDNDGQLGKIGGFSGVLKTFKPLDLLQAPFMLPCVWASTATEMGMERPTNVERN
jgi:hypothetical protein